MSSPEPYEAASIGSHVFVVGLTLVISFLITSVFLPIKMNTMTQCSPTPRSKMEINILMEWLLQKDAILIWVTFV